MWRLLAVVLVLGACHARQPDYLGYDWNGRRVLCSDDIDDLGKSVNKTFFERQLALAGAYGWVLTIHAHAPTVDLSLAWLDQLLTWADEDGLRYYTYRQLDEHTPPHGGLALAFDDNAPDQWVLARDTLARHGAHVTFFVSRWDKMTPLGHQEIATLYGDGDDIEPHSVNHVDAVQYVQAHGIDAYITNEVLPSFTVLTDAGYPPPTAYAYPFGLHTSAIDRAVLQHVAKVRTTPGECPWDGWHG